MDLFNIWPWLRAESSKSFGQCQLPSVTWEREQSVLKGRTWFAWIWLSLGKLKFFQEHSVSQCHGWGWREIPVWAAVESKHKSGTVL